MVHSLASASSPCGFWRSRFRPSPACLLDARHVVSCLVLPTSSSACPRTRPRPASPPRCWATILRVSLGKVARRAPLLLRARPGALSRPVPYPHVPCKMSPSSAGALGLLAAGKEEVANRQTKKIRKAASFTPLDLGPVAVPFVISPQETPRGPVRWQFPLREAG
jgi:hypothetical protein